MTVCLLLLFLALLASVILLGKVQRSMLLDYEKVLQKNREEMSVNNVVGIGDYANLSSMRKTNAPIQGVFSEGSSR